MSARIALALAVPALLAFAAPAHAQASKACEPKDLAALAGWNGVWIADGKDTGIDGRSDTNWDLAGLTAPWTDEGWNRLRTAVRLSAGPQFKQAGWGFPMMMNSYSEFTFVISPAETAIISQYRDIRHVFTDGRDHLSEDDRWPTEWGDSVGCWNGDTLTIDTVSVKFDPSYNPFAPPLSEEAHFVEHLRQVSPDRIEGDITITDPVYLTGQWTLPLAYNRAKHIDRLVHDTFENDRTVAEGDSQTIAPPKDEEFAATPPPPEVALTPAELDRVVGTYAFDGAPLKLLVERRDNRLFFEVPPALSAFLPLYPQSPLSFISFDGGNVQFVVDAAGAVTGFTGTAPDGSTMSGKRANPS